LIRKRTPFLFFFFLSLLYIDRSNHSLAWTSILFPLEILDLRRHINILPEGDLGIDSKNMDSYLLTQKKMAGFCHSFLGSLYLFK
jgi:hypothetical protein